MNCFWKRCFRGLVRVAVLNFVVFRRKEVARMKIVKEGNGDFILNSQGEQPRLRKPGAA
jgi:hypothetical protein